MWMLVNVKAVFRSLTTGGIFLSKSLEGYRTPPLYSEQMGQNSRQPLPKVAGKKPEILSQTSNSIKFKGSNVVTKWQKLQIFYQGILENGDKRTDNWLLVYSPVPITCIFMCYLIIIWVGPKLMANREPINLKPVLIVYNFAMVCLSVYMFFEFTASSWLARYSLLCQPVDYTNSPLALRMARVCWWFYLSKVIELSDTIFFILRKKNSQLTFLHVYHHATMIFNWWAGVKYVAGGQSFLIGLINSLVHIVMYLYYGLAALGPHMKKYLWWKQYLTSLQLLQFFIVTMHTTYNLFADCDFPDSMNAIVLAYSLSLIALFSNFYYQNYLTKKTKKAKST